MQGQMSKLIAHDFLLEVKQERDRKSSAALLQSSIETQWSQNNFLRMHSYLVMITAGCENSLAKEMTLWSEGTAPRHLTTVH